MHLAVCSVHGVCSNEEEEESTYVRAVNLGRKITIVSSKDFWGLFGNNQQERNGTDRQIPSGKRKRPRKERPTRSNGGTPHSGVLCPKERNSRKNYIKEGIKRTLTAFALRENPFKKRDRLGKSLRGRYTDLPAERGGAQCPHQRKGPEALKGHMAVAQLKE